LHLIHFYFFAFTVLKMKNFFANLGSHPTITLAPFDAKLYGENMGVGRIDIDDIVRHSGGTNILI